MIIVTIGHRSFFMLIWLAGLTGVPELREAARGRAMRLQSFWHVEHRPPPDRLIVAAITTIVSGFYAQWAMTPTGAPQNVNTAGAIYLADGCLPCWATYASVILFGLICS
jgi:ABC-type sugar transport system permease subunit